MLRDKQFIRVDNEEEYEKLYEMCKLEFGFKGDYTLVDEYPVILEISDIISTSINDNNNDYDIHFYRECDDNTHVNKILNSKYCIPFSSLNNYVLKTELLEILYQTHQENEKFDIVIVSKDTSLLKIIANYFVSNYEYEFIQSECIENTRKDTNGLYLRNDDKKVLQPLFHEDTVLQSFCIEFTDDVPTHVIDADYFINKDVIYDKINEHLYKDGEITSKKIDVVNFLSEVMYEEAKVKQ
jgi:hypothetical protein